MTEKQEKKNERLVTTISMKKPNNVTITVSAVCGNWNYVQKLLSDFENTLLKGNNGKT